MGETEKKVSKWLIIVGIILFLLITTVVSFEAYFYTTATGWYSNDATVVETTEVVPMELEDDTTEYIEEEIE